MPYFLINTYFLMKCANISSIISIIITLFLANDIILKSYTLYQNSDLMITAFYSTCCMLFVIYLKNVGKKYLLILSSLFLAMSVWTRGEYPVSIIIFLIVFMVLFPLKQLKNCILKYQVQTGQSLKAVIKRSMMKVHV